MGNYLFPPSSNTSGKQDRKERITYSALSGFLVGTICAIVATFINVWLYADLPIYISWLNLFWLWLLWAGMGSLLAGIAAASPEGWSSILLSAFGMAVTILIVNFTKGVNNWFLNILVLIGLSFPMTAILAPVAYLFYWLSRRFAEARDSKGWGRWKILIVNIFVIITSGFLPGLYSKFDGRAEQGVRVVYDLLQRGSQADSPGAYPVPLTKTEGYTEHKDKPYQLSQAPSIYSTVGLDVTAHYKDGYTIQCTVILYPGRDAYLSPCKGILP